MTSQQPGSNAAAPPRPLPAAYNPDKHAQAAYPDPNIASEAPALVVPLNQLLPQPQWIDCPFCHQRTMTSVRREGTSMQIVVGAVLCFVCVCLTCVPCLAGWFEDTEFRCSSCNNMVARRHHDGPLEIFGPPVAVQSQYAGNEPMSYPLQQHNQPQQQQPQPPREQHHQPQVTGQQHEMNEIQPMAQPQYPPPVKS